MKESVASQETGLVLVAEDNDMVRHLMSRSLRKAGFGVLEARDGDEAYRLISDAEEEIEAFCVDGVMPGHPTAGLIDLFLERWPGHPVVLCSGYLPDALGLSPSRSGVFFLAKPFRGSALVEAVSERVGGRQR